jgi:GNAT superfamily N-acetyltransferase/pyrimidine deaminase RibD-like protein
VGRPAQARSDYHAYGQERPGPGKNFYVVEPDGSLQPDDSDDSGLEFVSPPLPIDDIMSDLNKVKAWANRMGCYTNDSTGLHINISVPNYSIDRLDYVKLALLMGDEYVLNDFGRAGNTYAKSAMGKIRGKVTPENAKQILDKMKSGLDQLATKAIHSGITDKYTSINTKDGHIEFRSPGGDWLDDNFEKIENTLMRFTVAMSAALNPEAYRQEYLKKLYKMLAPKGETDPLAIFAKYAAGELPKAALKSFIRQAQLVRGNKAAQQAELDTMYKDLAPAPGEVNQGNWGIWLGSVNQFSRVPGEYSAGEPVPLRRFPSQEAAEQFLTQTRASNPRMRADAEVREIEPTTAQAAPTDSNQGNWGVWVPSLNRYATIGNLEPRRFLRHGDAQAWIQDYNTRHVGNNVELSVREIEPTTAPAAPEPGSVQWNIINGDNQVAHTFWNTNRQSDANQAGSAWIWSQRLNHFAGRGPWQIVPAANSAASSEPIPGSTQDLQRQRQRDAALAAASMAADAEHAANRRTPTPIPGVQDIEIDIPMAQTQWEVYNRSSNQPVFTMYAENQANAWRKGQEWVATAMQTDPTIDASNFSVRQSAQPVSESREITKLHKLDSVLKKCISMIHRGKQINPKKYGGVAACLIDNKNNHTYAINMPGPNGTRRHAERMAIDKHLKRHGRIGPNAIMVTTLSPCVHDMRERDGESCTELLSDYGIEKCYAGWQDPTQHPATDYPFNLQVTDNADIFNTCQDIAASFLPQVVANELNETVNPDCFDPAFNDTQHFDGLTYRATVQEEHGKPVLTIKVLDDNFQQVGVSKFKQSKKGVVSLITSLKPEYQGQGIARNIYAYVRMLGNTIVPSRNQLPPGKAMWNAWKKSGDAKHLMKDVAEDADGNIEIRSEPTSTGGVQVYAYRDGKEVGWVRFQKAGNGKVKATMVHVPERLRRQGIGSAMYKHARHSLGLDIVPSDSQTADGRLFWNKIHEVEEEPIRINLGNNNAARAFIERVYARYPYTMQNNHVMVWGKGDEQQFAMFELIPSFSKRGAVEVKWFQAYPLRQGVGSKAMKELQAMAREDGISLTLFPWDKGQVSQSKLTKFYRGQGFKPAVKGSKAMQWEPISERKQHPLEDFEGLKFRIVADSGQLFVNALDPTGNNELGHVVFDLDDSKELYPRDLFIKDKFRSQGIARIMYDFVKSKGYTIQRSWDQTDAGSGFWNKHKGEDVRVWEQNDLAEERTHHPDHKFKTAYHITSTENAEEILYSGLDPYDGKAFMVVDEGDKTKLQRELSMVGGWMYAKTEGSDDPLTLLKIDVTGIPLTYDQGWYFSTTKIPPDRIQDLGAKELARYV